MFHIRTPSTLTILVVEPTGTNTSIQCLCYLGKGGIAIMYKKELELSICLLINLDSTRIIGIELRQSCDRSVFIFGAFPPLIILFSHLYQNWILGVILTLAFMKRTFNVQICTNQNCDIEIFFLIFILCYMTLHPQQFQFQNINYTSKPNSH